MKIEVAYGRDIDDDILEQLMYMMCDASAYYDNLNKPDDEKEAFICAIPTITLKQFKRKAMNIMFLMKIVVDRKIRGNTMKKRKLVGMACISKRRGNMLLLHDVFVKPTMRRKGIGRTLVCEAMKIAKRERKDLMLTVNPLNDAALKLYKDVGFKIRKDQSIWMESCIKNAKTFRF